MEEIGEVQPHIKNLLNQQNVSASVLIAKLNDDDVVKFLESNIESQRDEINEYAAERRLRPQDVFPRGQAKFTFTVLDKLMLSELAKLVQEKGIKEFLPPPVAPRQSLQAGRHLAPSDYTKEVGSLRCKLVGRYNSQ